MEKHITQIINSAGIDRENLVIVFDLQLQRREVFPDVMQQGMKFFFRWRKNDNIIGIPPIIPDPLLLLQPMVKVSKKQVRKILGKIVADWNAVQ